MADPTFDDLLKQGGTLNAPGAAPSFDDLVKQGGKVSTGAPTEPTPEEPQEGTPPLLAKPEAQKPPEFHPLYWGTQQALTEDVAQYDEETRQAKLLPDPNKGLFEDAARIMDIFSGSGFPTTEEGADKGAMILALRRKTGLDYLTIASRLPEFIASSTDIGPPEARPKSSGDPWRRIREDPIAWVRENPKLVEYVLRNPDVGVQVPWDPGLDKLSKGWNAITGYIFPSEAEIASAKAKTAGIVDPFTGLPANASLGKATASESLAIAPPAPGLAKQTAETEAINASTFGEVVAVAKRTKETVAGINKNLTMWEIGLARHPVDGSAPKPTWLLENRALDFEQESQPGDYRQGDASKLASSAFSGAASSIMVGKDMAKGAGGGALVAGLLGGGATVALTKDPATFGEAFLYAAGVGAKLGGKGGAYYGTVKMEGGAMYSELLNSKLDDGSPLPEEYAWAGAMIGANLKAAIEVGTLEHVLPVWGPIGQMLKTGSTKQTVAALLKKAPFMAAVKKLAKEMGEATVAESGEEGFQALTGDAVKYFISSLSAGQFQQGHYGAGGAENLPGGLQETLEAVPSSAMLAATGAVTQHAQAVALEGVSGVASVLYDEMRARAGIDIAQHHLLSDLAHESAAKVHLFANLSDSPTIQADPEGVAEVMAGNKPFFIDAPAYVKFNQDQKVDPSDAAKAHLGEDGPQRLKEALATGKPLEVPAADYLEKMPLETRQALEPHTTTRADLPTPAAIDKKAFDAKVEALLERMREGPLEAESEGEAEFLKVGLAHLEQMEGSSQKAQEKFELMRAVVRTYSDIWGQSADELFRNFALTVSAGLDPTMEEVLQKHAETVNRAEELLRDENTGLPNQIALEQTRAPAGKPLIGHMSVEGFKWLNDNAGHEKADLLARAVGNALHGVTQPFKLPGADFAFHVKDQAELDSIAEKVRQALPEQLRGFAITTAIGAKLSEAAGLNQSNINRAVAEGTRANPRPEHAVLPGESGKPERPKGVPATLNPKELQVPTTKASGVIAPEAVESVTTLKPQDYFDKAYRDPVTGEWTERAWKAMRRKAHVVMIDAAGLGNINATLGKEQGNLMLKRIGLVANRLAGHRVDFTHLHGDEYCAQSDSLEHLEGFVDQLQALLSQMPLEYTETETPSGKPELRHKPISLHTGFAERSLEKADDDLNKRKDRAKEARAAGILRGGSESAGPRGAGRREEGGNRRGDQGPDRRDEEEPAGVPGAAQETAGDAGLRNGLPLTEEQRQLDFATRKGANARSPVMRRGWKALAKWVKDGKKPEGYPKDVNPAIEKAAAAAVGLVGPEGIWWDERGRDLRTPMKSRGYVKKTGKGDLTGNAADAFANKKAVPMSRAFYQEPDERTLFYQFPTPEESLARMQERQALTDIILESGAATVVGDAQNLIELLHKEEAMLVDRLARQNALQGNKLEYTVWAHFPAQDVEHNFGSRSEAEDFIKRTNEKDPNLEMSVAIWDRDFAIGDQFHGDLRRANLDQLGRIGIERQGNSYQLGREIELHGGETGAAEVPASKNLPHQAALERGNMVGFGTMLDGGVLVPEGYTGKVKFEQSTNIRTGEERLPGINPADENLTRDIAIALERRQRKRFGTIARNDFSPEAAAKISQWISDEVAFEMQPGRSEKSGAGWYKEKFQRALDLFATEFPELAKDKRARNMMTLLVAVTSDGQKVYTNFKAAAQLYAEYRKPKKDGGGRVPTKLIGSQRAAGMEANFERINQMLEGGTPEQMHKFLLEERTVSELKKLAKEQGIGFSTEYKADVKLPMAALVLGPKLGAFYANLMGADGYLTMDRWWSRTFNRYRGQLVPAATRPGLDRFKELLSPILGRPAAKIDDDEAILHSAQFRNAYEAKGFKDGSEIEKAANTIYKAEFEELEDTPFNAGDRSFMLETVRAAKAELAKRGVKVSVADIQAVLWYYEKRLYSELGARSSADVSYEEVAKRVARERFEAKGGQPVSVDRPQRRSFRGSAEDTVVGPDGNVFNVPVDEDVGRESEPERIARQQRAVTQQKVRLAQGTPSVHPLQAQLDQHEAKLRDRKGSEAFVALDEQGRPLIDHTSGEARVVRFTGGQIQALIEHGNATMTHNHPSGLTFSVEDINMAVVCNAREMRAVAPDGTVFRLARPAAGWGIDFKVRADAVGIQGDPQSKANLRDLRQALERWDRGGVQVARWEMDAIIRAAGGDPKDGAQAKGFDRERWSEILSRSVTKAFNEGAALRGWGWQIEVLGANEGGASASAVDRRHAARVQAKGRLKSEGKEKGEQPRGYTEIYNDGLKRMYDVVLNPNADLSTFLHESAHIFLDMMGQLALRPDAPDRLRLDWAATLKYLGAKNHADLVPKTDAKDDPARLRHEKFATVFERYLYEGKAPSAKLEGAFKRYRLWMTKAYGDASKVPGADINDDIRKVFDRLLATDTEIEEQQKRLAYKPPLARDVLGMSPEQFQKHRDQVDEGTSVMRQRLDLAVAKDILRESEAWWKAELKEQRDKAKDEYEALPARQLQQAMANKGEVKVGPLDEAKVKEALGPDAKKLGKQSVKKGGADPGPLAEFFGYPTAEAMLKDLLALPQKNEWINAKADERMAEKYPDELQKMGELEKRVLEGLHSNADAEYLERELMLLSAKMTVPGKPLHASQVRPLETAREAARQAVESKSVRRLDAAGALAAERRSATKALQEATKGNYARAFNHYLERLTNFYMWKLLLEAEEMRGKFLKLASELAGQKAIGRLGKGSPVYRDEVAGALGELGLGPEFEGGFNPDAVVEQMEKDTAEGRTVVVGIDADRLKEIFAKVQRYGRGRPQGLQYTVLNVGELRTVSDALNSIKLAARNVATAIVDGKRIELQEAVDQTVAAIERSLPPLPPRPRSPAGSAADALMTFGGDLDAAQLRPETMLLHWLGGVENYAWKALGKPLQQAKHREVDLFQGPARKLIEASQKIPFAVRKRAKERIAGEEFFPGSTEVMKSIGKTNLVERWEFLELLKHMGNESNKKKALEGRNITEQQVMDAFVKLGITKEEMDYVQATWDAAESLKQESFDFEEKDTGIRPEEVVAVPFTTPWGQYRGGYHPVAYERATAVGQRQEANLTAEGYAAVGTNHNHLKSRVPDFTEVVSLDPYVIQRHIAQSVHDIAFRQPLRSVALVLRNKDVHRALIRTIGEARTNAIEKSLQDIGQQKLLEEPKVVYAAMQVLRGAMSVSVLGYSFGNAFEDMVTGVVGAMPGGKILPNHWAAGMKDVFASPVDAVAKYEAESGELRSRHKALARELAASTAKMVSRLPAELKVVDSIIKDHAFVMQEQIDKLVSAGVYAAAKRQALSEYGLAPTDAQVALAIEEAEAAVRLLMPGNHVVDASSIMRNRGLLSAMLVFHRFFNTQYNVTRTLTGRDVFAGKNAQAIATMGGLLFANVFAYAILGSLARGQGPDKGEPFWKWFLRKMATGFAGQYIFGNDISESLWYLAAGGRKQEPRNNSISGMVVAIGTLIAQAAKGDATAEKRVVAILKALGLVSGAVPNQFLKSADYLSRLYTGQVHARGPLDVAGGALYGQNKTPSSNPFTLGQDLLSGEPLGTGPH